MIDDNRLSWFSVRMATKIEQIERPAFVLTEHLEYLDELRESGETNMFGARPYLLAEYPELGTQAGDVLRYWMKSFGNPNR